MHFLLVFHVLAAFVSFDYMEVLIYSMFLMVSIFAYTSLMDKSNLALWAEGLKFIFAISLFIWQGGSWFGLGTISPALNYVILAYLLLSFFMSFCLMRRETMSAAYGLDWTDASAQREKGIL
jgi:hypothetical protein